MFEPDHDEGCPACSFVADNFASGLVHLAARDTAFVVISRAPLDKIERFKKRMGWTFPWLSSFGSDFNYDFLRRRSSNAARIEPVHDVRERGAIGKERVVLEHHADTALVHGERGHVAIAEPHTAGLGRDEPREHAKQRRLAAARGAQQREELAAGNLEVQILEERCALIALGDVLEADLHAASYAE